MNPLVFLIGGFFMLCVLRVPVAFSLAASAMGTMLLLDIPLTTLVNQMYRGLNLFPLLAVPFFLLVGYLMNESKITERLVEFSRTLVGHVRGGLAHVNVVVSMIFAGISGSSAADTAGVGSILIPAMVKEGYDRRFSVAITAASSTMGVIIPPSIYMVVYGAMGGVSIAALFLGGAIPGFLIGLSQILLSYYLAIKRNYPAGPRASFSEVWRAFRSAFWPMCMPVIIVGGVISGLFTATEAAVVAVVYGLFIMLVVYRSLKWRDLPQVFVSAAAFYASVLFAIASASLFGWVVAYLRGPEILAGVLQQFTTSPTVTLLLIAGILVMVGTFMSPVAAIMIFLPIVQRIGEVVGLHPVHLGVVVVVTLAMGLITPPYGLCLLLASGIGRVSIPEAMRELLPLLLAFMGIIVLIICVPEVVLFLPRLLLPTIMG